MVTSTKLPEKKVVKMSEQNSNVIVPQRTLLGEVNAHLTCYICRGYYIDATTIVECLHSFCRSCIIKHLQVKSYCPVCEMMINSAKPNIKPDKALQDIVYKLVPGLFQREMERRQQFYASRPGPAASATPEQRGEDTERIIFSPEDVISFSLEYVDLTDADSISSKSSDSNEHQALTNTTRRYLQCPAVVNISHLKKFLSMKFDIDCSQFSIDILYKRVPLPDYYTLMDIAYIYNWKRNEPMRFFYQIIDYVAIRNRYGLFDINRKGTNFRDRKSSPTTTEDTNVSSPAPLIQEHCSEASSGPDSPMTDDTNVKKNSDTKKQDKQLFTNKDLVPLDSIVSVKVGCVSPAKKTSDEDVEKSQFLNSFELTAKNNCPSLKSAIKTLGAGDIETNKLSETFKMESKTSPIKIQSNTPKIDENVMKRKASPPPSSPDFKKIKIDTDKSSPTSLNPITINKSGIISSTKTSHQNNKTLENITIAKSKELNPCLSNQLLSSPSSNNFAQQPLVKDIKNNSTITKHQLAEQILKRPMPPTNALLSPKRKTQEVTPMATSGMVQEQNKSESASTKLPLPLSDAHTTLPKVAETLKPVIKKMPELKLGVPSTSLMNQSKGQLVNKVRMDLLANNCDPTMDRSKILSQVKSSMAAAQGASQMSGDPLKSLFDSCKINIPSSLSITLTDQKLDQRNMCENITMDTKKSTLNNNSPVSNTNNVGTHKVPSLPVHNYIEILKLPDVDTKSKPENTAQSKPNLIKKPDTSTQLKAIPTNKPVESTSAKGPIPSLKPIGETKLGKQAGIYSMTSPYQQKYIQSLEQSEKSKLPKSKMQVPKLMPATSKILNSVNKDVTHTNKNYSGTATTPENKTPTSRSDNVLDLSTTHNVKFVVDQSQLGPQQTKTLETMQTIAKKQNQSSPFTGVVNRPLNTESPLRIPAASQIKSDKINNLSSTLGNNSRPELSKPNSIRQITTFSPNTSSPNYQASHSSPSAAQPSPRSQTRSPSSSPKLVIAEETQSTTNTDSNANQSNQISSTQISSTNASKTDSLKQLPGPSKLPIKPLKSPIPSALKLPNIRQPMTPMMKPGPSMNTPSDILLQPQMISQAFLRQMEWFKNQHTRQYENLLKNVSNAVHQKDLNKDNK